MLLPRRVKSRTRIVRYFLAGAWRFWRRSGNLLAPRRRPEFLGLFGPLSLVALLIVWAAGLIFGFGCLYWSLAALAQHSSRFLEQIYFSGVTFFTLGYGDFVPHERWSKVLSVLEAGTGFGFIAMVIGYLPVLYQLFSRRETHVLILDAIAGSPPNATTLLCRHAEGRSLHKLDSFFGDWQRWAAEILESHLSYPMLAYYRSQHDNQSWLASLASVMDATVLVMVGLDEVPSFQARLTFATTRFTVVEMVRVLGIAPRELPQSRLSRRGFESVKNVLTQAALNFLDPDAAEERLASSGTPTNPFLNGLAEHLELELPAWTSDPDQIDNWVRSPRGKAAKRLVESTGPAGG